MPIKIPQDLPARATLEREGVLIIGENDAIRQDIRPLRIALLNLMPKKIETETQIARVLAGTPLQVEMTLFSPSGYVPKNTPREHMIDFYRSWEEIRQQKFDGLIVTGAPVEKLPFEQVVYWDELRRILDWATDHVHGLFALCWGAQAALYHYHGVPKYQLPEKRFGVFRHRVLDHTSLLMRGLDDEIQVPVSRHTENRREDLAGLPELQVLIESDEAGLCLLYDRGRRRVYMFNHLEYDSITLHNEYMRDLEKAEPISMPRYYYPGDDPSRPPVNTWRGNGQLLYANWINSIYQTTPFDLEEIGR